MAQSAVVVVDGAEGSGALKRGLTRDLHEPKAVSSFISLHEITLMIFFFKSSSDLHWTPKFSVAASKAFARLGAGKFNQAKLPELVKSLLCLIRRK